MADLAAEIGLTRFFGGYPVNGKASANARGYFPGIFRLHVGTVRSQQNSLAMWACGTVGHLVFFFSPTRHGGSDGFLAR
jgi:hypothetical protein